MNLNSSSHLPTVGWGSGTTLTALPYKDLIASTRGNHDFVKKVLAAAKKHNKNFDPYGYNDDAMWWGTAAMYAHRAYGDAEFLQYAKDVWERVHKSQVTSAQAKAGKSPVRAQKIKSTCGGDSVAGGMCKINGLCHEYVTDDRLHTQRCFGDLRAAKRQT